MLILGFDVETTGLDPKVHAVSEVGMALWDTEARKAIKVMGYLVDTGDAPWERKAQEVSGLSPELCKQHGYPNERALKQLLTWYQQADMVCAHNGFECDQPFLNAWVEKYGWEIEQKLWLDTLTDIVVPARWSRKLPYLAAEFGFLNPFPHRAVFDVMTMFKVLDQFPLESVIERAKSPRVSFQALVSYDDRDKAKQAGYFWKAEDKQWLKKGKLMDLETEKQAAEQFGFKLKVIDNAAK